MTFKFDSKHVLLTYAQCGDLCGFDVNNHLGSLGAECIVGRENHVDGGTHLHVFAVWERRFQSRRPDVFDVGGRHPNIVSGIRSPVKAYDYATKDGDVVAGGLERPSGERISSSGDKWTRIVEADTEDEFWCRIRELDPKALCTNYPSLRKFADFAYAPVIRPYESPAGLEFTSGAISQLVEWRETYLEPSGGEFGRSDTFLAMVAL